MSVTIPVGTAQGTWRLLVEGDADNAVAESVEANNIGFVSINVTGENTGGADIVTQITQLSTRNVDPGDVVTMTWFVRNIGTETANNAYSEKVFLSANTTLDASDTQIGSGVTSNNAGPLRPGTIGFSTEDVSIPPGTALGSWYILVEGDAGAVVAESDETNNVSVAPITVVDTTPPVVTPPADVTVEASGPTTPVSLGSASASDDVDGSLTPTPDITGPFAVGATTVTWSATDGAGNTGTAAQTVTVTDTTAPVVTPPANITVEATGASGAVVGFALPAANDLADPAPTVVAVPASGSTFALGATIVTVTATDASNNSSQVTFTVTFTVTVTDTTPPAVTPPADVTAEAMGTLTPVSIGAATADDLVDGAVAATSDAPAQFPLGATVVTWSATDAAGNSASATQTVTVADTTAPVVTAPADVTAEATGTLTPVSIGAATADDLVDGAVLATSDAPAQFPLGATVVTWSATDAAGNSASATQTVTVTDSTAPAVTAPADVTAEATGTLTTVSIGAATADDLVDGAVAATSDAPAQFLLGATVVTWSATDAAGNSASATQTVTVADTTAPAVTAPADVTTEATGTLTTVSLGAATADDLVDGAVAATSDAPTQFPLGATVVTWSATDAAGNSASATQTVTVADTTAPVVTAPADVTTEATGTLTTVSLGAATADDLVDGSLTPTPDNSGPFPVGVTVVTWSATDSASNVGTATQTVTVTDSSSPTVTPPADITTEATGPTTPVSLGTATALDDVDGPLTPTPDITGPFLVGLTTVTWSATDTAGNEGSASQNVTVTDLTPPTVSPPADVTVEATGEFTEVALGSAAASDLVDGSLTPTPDNSGPFPVGVTVVTWSATDAAGNSASATQTVTVVDTTAPAVTAPADVTAEATGTLTTVSIGAATADDLVDGAVAATSDAPAQFPLGATVVTWSATDAAGNSASATQTVTVTDSTAPAVTAPADVTAEATGTLTTVSLGAATADDLVDGAVAATSDAPAQFPLGATVVTWSATDAAGNSASATQTVTVADTTAPAVTAPADVTAEATGTLTTVSIGAATADDLVDGAVAATSDAPAQFPLGATVVTWSATDAAGNSASATQTVTVADTTAPAVTAPADVTVPSTGTLTDVDLGTASASDLVGGALTPTADDTGPFPVGTTTVTWSAIDAAGNTGTATQDVTVIGAATMHLGDLDGAPDTQKNQWWVTVTITVHDGNEGPLANATVSGSWSGASSGDGACVTDAVGQCSVESAHVHKKNDGMTFTVTDVSLASNSYVAADNHDPDSDSSGTAITVTQSGTPSNQPPTANAGTDQTVTDSDDSGSELVTLDGAGSSDSDGNIVAYEWSEGGSTIATGASPTVTLGVGAHTITLTVTDDGGASDTDQVTVVVLSPNPSDTMHVGDLDGAATGQKGQWQATVTVTVHDAAEQAVANAVVSGNWSGGFSGADYSCTTGAGGQCSVTSGSVGKRNASMTFTVGGVTDTTLTYDAPANHDPDGDSTGTAITVNKP